MSESASETAPLNPPTKCCGAPLYGSTTTTTDASGIEGQVSPSRDLESGLDTTSGPDETSSSRDRALIALKTATVFCFLFMICEIVGGYFAHSLAILTDAAHLLTDVGGFALAIFSLTVAARAACGKFSYGWHRAEVVGTLTSVFTIWGLVLIIVYEAVFRIYNNYQCYTLFDKAPSAKEIAEAKASYKFSWLGNDSPGYPSVKHFHLPSSSSEHDPLENLITCEAVKAPLMVLIGLLGLTVNLIVAGILTIGGHHGHSHGPHESHVPFSEEKEEEEGNHHSHHHHGHSHGSSHSHGGSHGHSHGTGGEGGALALNSAFLHALGDSIQSLGVVLAAAFIWIANIQRYGVPSNPTSPFNVADAASSILFAIITLFTTRPLFKQLIGILMESTPDHIDAEKVERQLRAIPGVSGVHDLHIWSINAEQASLSVHVVAATGCQGQHANTLKLAQEVCNGFGITHHTIQVDDCAVGSANCRQTLH